MPDQQTTTSNDPMIDMLRTHVDEGRAIVIVTVSNSGLMNVASNCDQASVIAILKRTLEAYQDDEFNYETIKTN